MLFLKKNLVKIEIFNTITHQKCNKTWTGDCFLEIFEEIKAQNLNLTTLKQILASFEAYLNQILKKILLLFLSFLLLLSQQKKFHCCHVATKFYTTKWTCLPTNMLHLPPITLNRALHRILPKLGWYWEHNLALP